MTSRPDHIVAAWHARIRAARDLHAVGRFVTLTNIQRETGLDKGVIGEALRVLHDAGQGCRVTSRSRRRPSSGSGKTG
jgi:hypothetical protein